MSTILSNHSGTVATTTVAGLELQESDYSPYLPYATTKEERPVSPAGYAHARPTNPRFKRLRDAYDAVSWICGFKEKYSLALMIFFGGALVGFCLARSIMMSPANLRSMTVSGEWFWYRQSFYKPCIFIHVYLSIISGVFAIFQFLPAIRRRAVILHRINGYMVLALLTPSTVGGAVVARRAFGGDLNVQSAFYVISFLILGSAAMGITNVRRTRVHRKWMLRTVAFAAIPVTARLASIAARHIISDVGTYYATWRCDQLIFVENGSDAINLYPQCTQPGVDPTQVYVSVHAAIKGNGANYASTVRMVFGMALWVGTVLHIIGVEIYIRKSDSSNRHRRGFVLERNEDDEVKSQSDDH